MATAEATKILAFSETIQAPAEHLWSMLSNRDDVCDWLCYDAHLRFDDTDGFAVFIWREGPHVYGVYREIVVGGKIAMTWQDGTDQVTAVTITLEDTGDGVRLDLRHTGFSDPERAEYYQKFWAFRLRNLKSILETGAHLDIVERVIVGVIPGRQTEDGIPVENAIAGYSAADAGIQGGDLIVAINGQPLDDERGIYAFTENRKPGDTVDVTYRRDGADHTVKVTLKGYPVPPIPDSFDAMARQHREGYDSINALLKAALEGVSADTAAFSPAEDQWSIRQILAHMILQQRHTLEWLSTYAVGPRRINPYTDDPERMQALVQACPTLDALVNELTRVQDETVALINALDKAMEARKGYLWWMTFEVGMHGELYRALIRQIEECKREAAAA